MKKNKGGIVYSTNPNFGIEKTVEEKKSIISLDIHQTLNVYQISHKGRKKSVHIKNLIGSKEYKKKLCSEIKVKFGVGGSVKDNNIIIQGDIRQEIIKYLETKGFKCKRVGS